MNTSSNLHWEEIYQAKGEQQTSWFRSHLDESLRWIDGLDLPAGAPLLDVGGGRSTLVDDLLARHFTDISVLDLSAAALAQSRARLGERGGSVTWLQGDITAVALPPSHYALWHDRAVFHFLTEADAQQHYVDAAARAVRPGGHAVIATFAEDGPERCSGLPVSRYSASMLAERFAPCFEMLGHRRDVHHTPFDTDQIFTYVHLCRRPEAAGAPAL